MTVIATKARTAAIQLEAKKHALRQQQDGCWILTMKVHQDDMPEQIMKAAMGQRYICALVAIDDNEEPKESALTPRQQSPAGADKIKLFNDLPAPQQAGILCCTPAFWKFLHERDPKLWHSCRPTGGELTNGDTAAAVVRELCKVNSRAEITSKNVEWSTLLLSYRVWQKAAEVVPA